MDSWLRGDFSPAGAQMSHTANSHRCLLGRMGAQKFSWPLALAASWTDLGVTHMWLLSWECFHMVLLTATTGGLSLVLCA
jgi:hypothetical protein